MCVCDGSHTMNGPQKLVENERVVSRPMYAEYARICMCVYDCALHSRFGVGKKKKYQEFQCK